jgi:preprotein translocase subunit SecG
MQTVLLVVQLLIAVALIAVVLIQRTAQDGGGLMGGGATMGGLFTARGSANLLTRTTAVLATVFILNSLALGYIASSQHQGQSLVDRAAAALPAPEAPAAQVPAASGPMSSPVSTPVSKSAPKPGPQPMQLLPEAPPAK